MERKKIGLALGSGGSRGFCHVGVLQAFEEHHIPIDFISGCSQGALVGGCYCSGVSVEQMKQVAAKATNSAIMDFNISLKRNGLIKGEKAVNIVRKLIGDALIEDCKIPFRATASNINTGKLFVFESGKVIDAMRASMSIPIAFHSVVTADEQVLVDGGVIERIPIQAVKDLGAEIVIAVDALGALKEDYVPCTGFKSFFERIYLMMDWQSSCNKIKEADFIISPDQGDRSLFDFKNNLYSVEQGYKAAIDAMPQLKEVVGL